MGFFLTFFQESYFKGKAKVRKKSWGKQVNISKSVFRVEGGCGVEMVDMAMVFQAGWF